jgi:hypothetical protein
MFENLPVFADAFAAKREADEAVSWSGTAGA